MLISILILIQTFILNRNFKQNCKLIIKRCYESEKSNF